MSLNVNFTQIPIQTKTFLKNNLNKSTKTKNTKIFLKYELK